MGEGGVNQRDDVKLIQVLLNTFTAWKTPFTRLKIDGDAGKNTKDAIKQFQREMMNRKNPDGRVDPAGSNGRQGPTFHFLTSYIKPAQEPIIQKQVREGQMVGGAPVISQKTIATAAGLTGLTVIYQDVDTERQIVDEYSIRVIKMALKEAGLKTGVITSTIRTPARQAEAMLPNAKKDLPAQRDLYGNKDPGKSILNVYVANQSKKDGEIIPLMAAEIEKWQKEGKSVSRHCVTKEVYAKHNAIDFGLNAMTQHNPGFDANKFIAVLKKLKKEGYLEKFKDETKISNGCFHIEIIPNKMALAKYEENTILNTVVYC